MCRPVFFVHTGKQYYIKMTLKQAEKYCSRVILLGDKENIKYASEGYNQFDYLNSKWEQFVKVYKHFSPNPRDYELACFRRYFVIYEFMKQNHMKSAVMVDSDEMLYVDLSNFNLEDYDVAFTVMLDDWEYAWSICPAVMYFKFEALENIIDYMIDTYSYNINIFDGKLEAHKKEHMHGGICDMTLVYLWYKNQNKYKIYDFYEDKFEGWFDTNINYDDCGRFAMVTHPFNNVMKRMKKIDKKPYFIDKAGKARLAYGIQLQGGKKACIPAIYHQHFTDPWITISYFIYRNVLRIFIRIGIIR